MADPATYTKGDWTNLSPAATKAKMENIEDGIKAANDALVAETDAGRAITQAANAEAQRTALDVDSKAEVTGKANAAQAAAEATASADATAKANAAQAAAEGTASAALSGHVADADPHAQYQKEEPGKGLSTEDYTTAEKSKLGGIEASADVTDEANVTAAAVGTAEVTAAPDHIWVLVGGLLKRWTKAGFEAVVKALLPSAIEGGTATTTPNDTDIIPGVKADHTRLYYTWANFKAAVATFLDRASTTVKGIVLLGASGGAAKLTKMPDGATPVKEYASFPTTTGFTALSGGSLSSVSNALRSTYASGQHGWYLTTADTNLSGQVVLAQVRASRNGMSLNLCQSTTTVVQTVTVGIAPQIVSYLLPIGANRFAINQSAGLTAGDWFEVLWLEAGVVSYLTGSLSEEAARIANQRADMPGAGVYASQTITATDLATAGKGDTIHGKKYTFVAALTASPGVEGEVLKGATKEEELENENLAISEVSRANNGVKYWAAAVHPLVSSARVGAVLTLTAKTNNGNENSITVACESGTNHTAGGATLAGGYSDSAAKTIEEIKNNIAGNKTRPAAAQIELTNTALIGYETTVDVASGATFTLPAGGTWIWNVYGYGATISSAKRGSSAGGTTLTVAGANASVGYRRYA